MAPCRHGIKIRHHTGTAVYSVQCRYGVGTHFIVSQNPTSTPNSRFIDPGLHPKTVPFGWFHDTARLDEPPAEQTRKCPVRLKYDDEWEMESWINKSCYIRTNS
ncbi:hypothetical protein CFAM422_012487 [Trichoderma lentiforme]|uniref:Uncharacterized protein n=1 Tax=Trichoderma lentiforme TaxID=1567552 RepID=A0A9P4X456_9HYPO|nr:hypothetical protein CFAM422_012487 [Trichoderma lentiforme]